MFRNFHGKKIFKTREIKIKGITVDFALTQVLQYCEKKNLEYVYSTYKAQCIDIRFQMLASTCISSEIEIGIAIHAEGIQIDYDMK